MIQSKIIPLRETLQTHDFKSYFSTEERTVPLATVYRFFSWATRDKSPYLIITPKQASWLCSERIKVFPKEIPEEPINYLEELKKIL